MSLGPQIRIAYHVPGVDRVCWVRIAGDGSAMGGNDVRELGVEVRGNEEVRRIFVTPSRTVVVDSVEATMNVAIEDADALYLNGYNSWTDSVERTPDDRMWGLTRAPRAVVDKYILDASGDYRFVPEDARPGRQHGFGYGYLRQGDEVLLFGSLDEDSGFTLIQEDLGLQTLTFTKEPPASPIPGGARVELLSLVLTGGTLEQAVSRWLALSGIHAREAAPVVGFTSWYRHYGNIDAWKLKKDLEGFASVAEGIDLTGLLPVFQVDDGYAKVGDWLEYDCARFPDGMAALADEAREHGFVPGLWLAPFVCERASKVFSKHPDWLMRDEAGELVTTGSQWSGAVALDTRNEDVRRYIRKVLRTVTQEWGFGLLKLDFLYAACMVPHDGLNRGQLMADALDLLRESVADGTKLLFCGVPLVSAFGRCEYCRVGQDVGLDWDDKPHCRLLHRERVSTKLSLANARGRAHLDGKAFRCDPDVMFLRQEGVSLSASHRVEMFVTDTTCGGVLLTSDDMGAWGAAQIDKYHEAIERFRSHNGL